jgi:hypothetical protein
MYCINQIRPIDDNHCQLILKETSLLGIAKPIKYVDSQIKNGAPLPFVTGSVDEKGNFVTGTCRWEGARVENSDASVSLRLAGVNGQNWIIGNKGYDLYIQEPITAEQLKATFGDANRLPIHDYGVGDSIEIIRTLAK